MFYKSANDTSRVKRMTIISDATTWGITSDDSSDVIYDRYIFIIHATSGGNQFNLKKCFLDKSQRTVSDNLTFSMDQPDFTHI